MQVSREEVERIAALAYLDLSPEEIERMRKDLSEILGYVAQLQEVNVEGVEPMAQVAAGGDAPATQLRSDEAREGFTQAQALANAPQAAAGCFQVPRVLGNEGEA
ncbi:MAG: Asp-tRNA(Asn)/Glu-tRNA(Gln) amidotransferase subunit GatC [Terriglobales bacterium]